MDSNILDRDAPRLSIIIPTFNSALTIMRCLESIRRQDFADYEIVVQDGGSRDQTVEIIRGFSLTNPNLTVKTQQSPDQGVYDAMNKAVRRASGQWLYFLGSDDELHGPDVLKRVMGSKAAGSSDVIYGSVRRVGRESHSDIYDGRFTLTKLLCKNICHQAIFYKASFAKDIGEYNLQYAIHADWDYNLRCWSKRPFGFIDLTVALYSMDGLSGHGRRDPHFDADLTSNISRYFNLSAPHKFIVLSRIGSASKAEEAYTLRQRNDPSHLSAMTCSIVTWPFGDVTRYKVWVHMLLTRLGVIRGRERFQ